MQSLLAASPGLSSSALCAAARASEEGQRRPTMLSEEQEVWKRRERKRIIQPLRKFGGLFPLLLRHGILE